MKREALQLKDGNPKTTFYKLRASYYDGLGKQAMGLLDESAASFIKGIGETSKNTGEIKAYLNLGLAETYKLDGKYEKAHSTFNQLEKTSQDTGFNFHY